MWLRRMRLVGIRLVWIRRMRIRPLLLLLRMWLWWMQRLVVRQWCLRR